MGIMPQVSESSPLHKANIEATYEKLGKPVPEYRRSRIARHYFAIVPAEATKEVKVKVTDRFGNVFEESVSLK